MVVVCGHAVEGGGIGGGGVVIPTDEVAKVAGAYQFFDFILERFAFFCSMTVVAMVPTILGHVGVRRCDCLSWWGEEVSLEGLV